MGESCRVLFNCEFYIIKIKDKLLAAVRPKSIIEMVILRVLFY